MNSKVTCACTIAALTIGAAILSFPAIAPGVDIEGVKKLVIGDGGRLSPASLDVDTPGCPTTFGQPVCEQRTSWTLDKTTDIDKLNDPIAAPYSFDITVTEGPTTKTLAGGGTVVVTNSGDQTVSLASMAVLLESLHDCPGPGDAPGPSGQNWQVEAEATQAEAAACNDEARTCNGTFSTSAGASLVLFDADTNDVIALTDSLLVPPSLDDDGDGQRDEDPIDGIDNDGDGLVDEDGPCDDSALIFNFEYEFDVSGVVSCDGDTIDGGDGVVPSGDDFRIDLLITFDSGGRRGGTCNNVDVDCDGADDDDVRTVQQRLRFDLQECTPVCDCVQLTDTGASAKDEGCVLVTTDTLDEQICSAGEGTVTNRTISGTVTCIGENCSTTVNNTAELTCEDPELISGSPNGASFDVNCGDGNGDGDFCTQTQGGWGSTPSGNNPGACLHASFAALFPGGLVIGDSDGPDADACWAILLTDAQAVTDFLPTGGTPATLTADLIDPLVSSAGVFAGQLVAATINVAFSASAETCPGRDFPSGLGDLVYESGCVDDDLVGLSVNQVIAISNGVISGCSAPPAGVTISDLNDALSVLNENFVDCDTDEGCLESAI